MTIRLPMTANQLVHAALEQLDEEGKQIEAAMLGQILPQSIEAILQFNEQANRATKSYPALRAKETTEEVSRTLWSYPGSSGVARIRNNLQGHGISDLDATELADTILRYTRYPISIVNSMRHMRSSINSIRNALSAPKVTTSVLDELGISKAQLAEWETSSNNLNSVLIKNEEIFHQWLAEAEVHIRTYLPLQGKINRAQNGRGNPNRGETPGQFESFVARAYARRFGNYVTAHSKFKDADINAQRRGSTISDEFARLLDVYEGTDREIYEKLKSDFEQRANRISASASRHTERPKRNLSVFQSYIEQSLNINGKRVEIRTSSSNLPRPLVDQFIKSLILQYEMNPDQMSLSTRLNISGDSIEVEIERPIRADLKKVKTFIESMYLN